MLAELIRISIANSMSLLVLENCMVQLISHTWYNKYQALISDIPPKKGYKISQQLEEIGVVH